jgi:hypothetical protein
MRTLLQQLAVISLALLFSAPAGALTAEEARQDIAWRAELKGLAETDKARILDSFEKLQGFITVKEARNLCLESIRHAKPAVPEERTPAFLTPADTNSTGAAQTMPTSGSERKDTTGTRYPEETRKADAKKQAGKGAGKSVKPSTGSDGKLDHELLGLDRPLFPSILEGAQ